MTRGSMAYSGTIRRAAVAAAAFVVAVCLGVVSLVAVPGASDFTGAGAAFAQDAAPAPPSSKRRSVKAGPAAPAAADAAQPGAAKDPAYAARNYTEGVKAYQGAKFDAAVQFMSVAMQGGLAGNLVPKALYYRGAAYNRLHQSGLAISDLSSALYFRGGLDESDRAEALRQRSAAYAEAGLPDQPDPQGTGASTGTASAQSEVPKASGLGAGLGNIFGDLFGAKPAAAPAAPPQAQFAAAPAVAPPAAAAAPVAAAAASSPGEAAGEVLPWAKERTTAATSEAVSPAAGPEPQPVTAAAATPAAKPLAHKGHFRIQVASVGSRDEASIVISSLQSKGEPLASAPVSVDQQKFGAKTFYRVRLGPYPTAADAKAPCDALKAAGLDCLVTAK